MQKTWPLKTCHLSSAPSFGFFFYFPGGSEGKASVYSAGDLGPIPGSGRSPGERNGSPLQYSCLENPMDRGAWWATVHGVAKRQTRLSDSTTSLALNHSELKAPTVCPYEESIHSLLLPASLREGDQAGVHCPSGRSLPWAAPPQRDGTPEVHFSRPALPRFGTRGWFPGRRFFPGLGCRGWGWFGEDSTHDSYCALYFYYGISSTSDHQAFDPGV